MKKTFDFTRDDTNYILKNTKPDDDTPPFTIERESLLFSCEKFYFYVFSDITEQFEIVINYNIPDKYNNPDETKEAKRIYESLNQICTGIITEMNKLYSGT